MKLVAIAVPYLLLISFYAGDFKHFDGSKIDVVNQSPYHGIAVPIVGAYDTDLHKEQEFERTLQMIKYKSNKDLWPWIFFNRFIGTNKKGSHAAKRKFQDDYFSEIKGIDIYNDHGALNEFMNLWRMALKFAKRLGSPGIVVDPEAYNNYRNYNLRILSKTMAVDQSELKSKLREIGRSLTDIAYEIYPDAVIWFTTTGLGKNRSVTVIIEGMIERAREIKSDMVFISGVDPPLGYCHENLAKLESRVKERNKNLNDYLIEYPNLKLAGTIALWDKPESKKSWMLKNRCGKSELKTIKEFKPLLINLMRSYDYVWIYGAGASDYNAFNQNIGRVYNPVIKESLEEVVSGENRLQNP